MLETNSNKTSLSGKTSYFTENGMINTGKELIIYGDPGAEITVEVVSGSLDQTMFDFFSN